MLSAAYSNMAHGDKIVEECVNRVCIKITRPYFDILATWIEDGEIRDPYGETFIRQNGTYINSQGWHERWILREELVPSFIDSGLARKVTSIRQCCHVMVLTSIRST